MDKLIWIILPPLNLAPLLFVEITLFHLFIFLYSRLQQAGFKNWLTSLVFYLYFFYVFGEFLKFFFLKIIFLFVMIVNKN